MMKRVCVFAGSSASVPEVYLRDAYRLGELLAEAGIGIVYGAGTVGCMGCLADGAQAHGGEVIGVIPRFMVERGWCREGLSETHITDDMHSRKGKIHELADAIIALPGGIGTYEELTEAITWKQLGLHDKPILVVNTEGFYDAFLRQLETATETCFMGAKETTGRRIDELFNVVSDAAAVLQSLQNAGGPGLWS